MIFTVGFSYFYSVTQSQQVYQKAIISYQQNVAQQSEESLLLSPSATGNLLQIGVNNTGIGTSIVGYWLINNTMTLYYDSTNSTPTLPLFMSQGTEANLTNIKITTTSQYLIKILTSRGSIFTTTYPTAAVSLAAQALSSGAIGDLYLTFDSYNWYTVDTCGSNYCLDNQGSGFSIPVSTAVCSSCYTAFSISITNLNANQENITLDEYTQIMFFWGQGSSFRTQPWYIVDNTSDTISSTYSPITLYYNQAKTIVFASGTAGSFSRLSFSGNNAPNSGTTSQTFIVSHGWKGLPSSEYTIPYSNYGQNSPYVSTLFY